MKKLPEMWRWVGIFLLTLCFNDAGAQESLGPLLQRSVLQHATRLRSANALKGAAALSLPFFEDFTDYSPYPNPARWVDSQAYINNTMAVRPIARGVATLDALNAHGRAYDTLHAFATRYGDSLTSQSIDLSTYTAADNIYLSFFYQPQGNGFSPDPGDSLILYFHRKSGGWQKMWAAQGVGFQPFQQVILPINDTQFFALDFQFRFVNIVSINSNDDVWNIDYIRIGINRNPNDTAINDIAFTSNPTFLLGDYSYMPYRQYIANATAERAATIQDSIANHYSTSASVAFGYSATETTSGTPLNAAASTQSFTPYSINGISFPAYTTTPPGSGLMVFENKFYLQSGNPVEPKANDTIVKNQIFDNYLAYDDGSAEKSYFLNLFPTLPGKLALEYHLNVPDTLRGVAIYFGQQVPSSANKLFSIIVYSSLAGINNAPGDVQLYQEDDDQPHYTDSVNGFTIYRFANPVVLPSGVFYIGTTQPANSGSDSLYIGYDANRVGGNHLYFNVLNTWQSSSIGGAIMIRPLLGGPISGTGVANVTTSTHNWSLYPNPASTSISVAEERSSDKRCNYEVRDAVGKIVLSGITTGNGTIDIASLSPGLYLVTLKRGGIQVGSVHKFIKN